MFVCRTWTLYVSLFVATLNASQAEEGGSGHYFPGSMASFMDGVSPVPALIARLNVIAYRGGVASDVVLPIAGQAALDVDVETRVVGATVFWRPEWGSLGERWSYAMSGTVPFVDLQVQAQVTETVAGMPVAVEREDTDSGLGDIVLQPVMFNYAASSDLNANFRLSIYAPTGNYEVGKLANTSKNFWSLEPTVALIYLGQESGLEASLFIGVTFNAENPDTDYRSGTQAHMDGTLAQHFPAFGGSFGVGGTGYWYQQITDDSGSGASFGGFRARAHGLGPVLSYVRSFGTSQLLTELKWIKEFANRRRPEGDILFLKLMWHF